MREFVPAGEQRIRKAEGILSVLGVGSCIVIVLYDEGSRLGGLAHVLLPDPTYSSQSDRRGRCATTAIPDLLDELESAGAERGRITARLVGGACMFQELVSESQSNIGERNVDAARAILAEHDIPIIGEAVGGGRGRSIEFDLSDGRVVVSSQGNSDVEI
ncbi:MAG: chemotaxis protein CheD [Gemmatimonadota bacterium]|nr:MAG: chemotaxis protein CheD [Gemmatimonadota bacterium]